MGYITDIYAGFSFASTCPYPDGSFADGRDRCEWSHQFSYSTDPDQIPSDQTNYRVVITEACFSAAELTEFMTNVQSGGEDIRVTLSDQTTEIPFAVVAIDTGAETIELHARITGTTSATVATTLKIYTGNAAASAYALNATYGQYNCFQDLQYYLAMQQDPSGGILTDLTGNLANWTVDNMEAGDKVTQTNGMAAYTFDGAGDERAYRATTAFTPDQSGAVTALVKVNSVLGASGVKTIVGYGGSSGAAIEGFMVIGKRRNDAGFGNTDTHFDWTIRDDSPGATIGSAAVDDAVVNGQTYLLSVVAPGSGAMKLYLDGVDKAISAWNGSTNSRWFNGTDLGVGDSPRISVGMLYFAGAWAAGSPGDDTIGPVFQENTAPSANLQATRSNNYLTPGTFGQITGWVQS